MSVGDEEWPAARVFHITGGIRALNLDRSVVEFQPMTLGGKVCRLHCRSYRGVFVDIRKLHLGIVGTDTYAHALELEGKAPPDWRVFREGWPSWEQGQKWAEIANAGFETQNGYVWDLAARISHQWRVCSWRVRQASQAYAEQLVGCSKKNALTAGTRFEDGFTSLAYIAIQSYLVDICILRDYLAEFVANVVWKTDLRPDSSRITTMAGLLKKVLPSIPPEDSLVQGIKIVVTGGGWLENLGHYRDLVVHTAPLTTAKGRLFAIIEHVPFPEGQMIPYVRLPLPTNPKEIRTRRANNEHFSDFKAQFDAFAEAASQQYTYIDALDYVWEVHGQMADFAATIAETSPIEGRKMTFDSSNIIGDIRISE